MKIYQLPLLPFPVKALSGFLSEETLFYHRKKHHQGYVDKVNELLADSSSAMKKMPIEKLVKKSTGELFNNASQMWAHTFYWYSLASKDSSKSSSHSVDEPIKHSFKTWKDCKSQFVESGSSHFGSGWLWLVKKKSGIEWVAMHDAESPLKTTGIPLLTCDLWEHGYYLDYQNDRKAYLEKAFSHLNWRFAALTLERNEVPDFDWILRSKKEEKPPQLEPLRLLA